MTRPMMRKRQVHNFKRHISTTLTITNAAAFNAGVWNFKLSDLPNYNEFVALYDQYRICAVKVDLTPRINSFDINPFGTTSFAPTFYSVIDHTDTTPLATINEAMEYENCKKTVLSRPHKRYVKLSTLDVAGDDVATQYNNVQYGQWIGTEFPDVVHLGLKWCNDGLASVAGGDQNLICNLYFTIYLQCKSVK